MLHSTKGAAEAALAPQGMLCALGMGLLSSGGWWFWRPGVECGHWGLPGCPLPTTAAHIPLPPPSKKWINNQERRQKWGLEKYQCLNVTVSTRHRRVKVSFHPCVYCCLRTDLFPDTWAMTWKEFRLQQILHSASMWPLGLNKGKSITLLPWWPWHSRAEEHWCQWPHAGWWHRQTQGHPEGCSTQTPWLACAQQGHPGHARQPGWEKTLSPPPEVQQN